MALEPALSDSRIFGKIFIFLPEKNGNTVCKRNLPGISKSAFQRGQSKKSSLSLEASAKLPGDSGTAVCESSEIS